MVGAVLSCVKYSRSRQFSCTLQTPPGCCPDKEVRLVAGGLAAGVGQWPLSLSATLQEISALSSSALRMAEGSVTAPAQQACNLTSSSVCQSAVKSRERLCCQVVIQHLRLVIIYNQGLQSVVQSRSIQKYTLQNSFLINHWKQYIYINGNLYLQINHHRVITKNVPHPQ